MQQGEYRTGRNRDKLKREKETGIAIQKTNGITESGIKQHFNFFMQNQPHEAKTVPISMHALAVHWGNAGASPDRNPVQTGL